MNEPTVAELRRQLDALDDAQVEALCLDHFPEVYDRLGRGMRRDEKVTLLLDHCRRTEGGCRRLAEVIQERRERESLPAAAAPVISTPFNLPIDLADFTGREAEATELCQRLGGGGSVAMAGMGGVGKTALAVHVAHRLIAEGRFKDAQLYINLKGTDRQPLEAAAALGALLAAVAGPDPQRPAEEAALAGLWQAAIEGKDAVVILDNAAGAAQVRLLLPGCASCAVVVTSRQRFTLPGVRLIDVERMPAGEARALVQRLAPRLDDAGADEIARLCGGLPLAVRIAGNYMALNDDCSVGEYAKRLAGERALAQLRDPDSPDLDVAAAIGLSVEQLDEETRWAWALLGLFPASFDAGAARALWGVEEQKGKGAETTTLDRLRVLRNRSLMSYDDESCRYDLHDLLRLAARRDWRIRDEEIDAARERLARHYLAVAKAAVETQRYRALDADWPHLRVALEYSAGRDVGLLSDLVCSLTEYWSVRGMARDSVTWCQRAAEACAVAGRRQDEGVHWGNLGIACAALGETRRAIGYHEQALAIRREIGDRRGEGADLGNLGLTYADLGEVRQAIGYYEQALTIAREIGHRRAEGNHLGNLGIAYKNLGELQRAIGCYEQALAIGREIGDRRGEAADLGNLGNVYADLGEARQAIGYYEQALAIAREVGDRRGEGNHLGNLGLAYADLGEVRQAIGYYEQALAIHREIGDRRGEGYDLSDLGSACVELKEARRAIGYCEQALAISREIGDRRGEGTALGNLGLACADLGEVGRARELWTEALRIYEEIEDPQAEQVRGWLGEHDTDSHR